MKHKSITNSFRDMMLICGTAFLVGAICLLLAGVSPFESYGYILKGALGSTKKILFVVQTWVPLAMCACGLIYTFRAGLLNIGVEGQMICGAVCCTALLRWGEMWSCPALVTAMAIFAAVIGGALWALLAGILKTKGGVNEIFGGLGLNFIAQGAVLWLIFGPWKRPGIASMSGTELFPPDLWLPTLMSGRVSPVAVILVIILFVLTAILLSQTNLGLNLKIVNNNPRAAFLFGLKPTRYFLLSMWIAGGCAGLAGAVQAAGVYHRLIPTISGNYGYLALMVVMLANNQIGASMMIAFFFAGLNVGSIQLPLMMHLDSSLCGVLQGALVLSALVVYSRRRRRTNRDFEWTE